MGNHISIPLRIVEYDEDSESDDEELLLHLIEEENAMEIELDRLGKGNSLHPKAEYLLYPPSNVVERVVSILNIHLYTSECCELVWLCVH